ncbi:phosphoserine phosphatase [Brenneria izadpanahii]|uniref:Phosphoserine phosphatase n=1 Tax=Brenneria izadpanahii TaxID=2722756 RepID=A0ABX7UXP5_9GAMM|nr:phosphoserine phosphatase [Brenneria izadpanahii]QTF10140.1 phosphoserine phosphatase [Brenneria izadpanahii]
MSNSLTYRDLPDEINRWPGLPLSLSGNEVMPLDYRAGDTGWVLYGNILDKNLLSRYQRRLGVAMVIVSAWNVGDYQVVRLAGTLTPKATKLAHELDMDVAPMSNAPTLRSPGLLVMDMDSTAIQIECIDEIAKLAGTGDLVAEVTERAMRGELDFAASLRERVGTLKGADANILREVRKNLPLMPGLTNMVSQLQEAGWHVAIASGGFTYFADHLKDKLGLVAAVANEMGMRDGKLTGEVVGPIVDAKYKVATLHKLAKKLEIPLEQTVAIGDGANDLLMLKGSGLGIAYHAKPKVNEQSAVTIRHADLTGVLCILSGSMRHEKR